MGKAEDYRNILKSLSDWDEYLLRESGLPGPRGNLELAQAVADEGTQSLFERYLTYDVSKAPVNSPHEFLAFCGAVGLGKLIVAGEPQYFSRLRQLASDPRWRTREGVAMALQRVGDADMSMLLKELATWCDGSWLELRAVAAAVAEPRLLKETSHARDSLQLMDQITEKVSQASDRKNEDYKVLRQSLGYCWSVCVAALPSEGIPLMDRWMVCSDADICWIMKENLKKKRLAALEPWVSQAKMKLGIESK